MGLHLKRNKKRIFLLSIIYRFSKLLFMFSSKKKLNLYLNLEWIFDRLAHEESFKNFHYDKHPLRIYSLEFIQKQISPSDNVLDLGCNLGEISNKIAEFSNRVVGVDYDNNLITIAKTKFNKPNLNFICTDAFSYLEKTTEKFDVIILSHILEHIENPELFLKKCIPYTKKIFIELPDYDKTYLNYYRAVINNELNYTDEDHIWEFDRAELFSLLNVVDLKVIDCEFKFGVIKIWCETSSL